MQNTPIEPRSKDYCLTGEKTAAGCKRQQTGKQYPLILSTGGQRAISNKAVTVRQLRVVAVVFNLFSKNVLDSLVFP